MRNAGSSTPARSVYGLACIAPSRKNLDRMAERFQMHSGLKAEAGKMLHSYLAASALYGEWRWEPAIGLRRTKRRAAAPLKENSH